MSLASIYTYVVTESDPEEHGYHLARMVILLWDDGNVDFLVESYDGETRRILDNINKVGRILIEEMGFVSPQDRMI